MLNPKDPSAVGDKPPLILHLVHRFAIGGLENGIVNLINFLPPERYRHAIVSLTDYTDFRQRIRRADVPVLALHKSEGHDLGVYWRFWRILLKLRPTILHTRNLPTLEFAVLAALARVRGRVHGEHGRDVYDIDGLSAKYRMLRRLAKPFVHQYITVSDELAHWLTTTIGIPSSQVLHIYNGVEVQRFTPRIGGRGSLGPPGFATPNSFIIGTVGRMQTVKNQVLLVRAFLRLLSLEATLRERVRLVVVGDGPLREECLRILHEGGAANLAWLPGEREDIPDLLRSFDVFVLPSLAEGISNTILEAMASGVAVVATCVGGNAELVLEEKTGTLVPPEDVDAMARVLATYVDNPEQARIHGSVGRARIVSQFSMQTMIEKYGAVYDSLLGPTASFHDAERQPLSVLRHG
jgi:sugar transferase (PEP-CTERM/EpsH1 system associated)